MAPYTVDDGSDSFCAAALLDAGKWTEVIRKAWKTSQHAEIC